MRPGWERGPGWGVVDRDDEGEHGGTLYAAPLDTGVIHVLRGPAAVVCRAAFTGADTDAIRTAVARELGAAAEDVDVETLEELLEELVALGVLRPAGRSASSAAG